MKLLLTLLLLTACGGQDVQTDHARSSSTGTTTTETETTSTLEGSITGPKGDTGAQGPKGEKGDKGDSGIQAESTPSNLWSDPITKKSWLIGNIVFESSLLTATPCTDGWILPTKALAIAAVQHGLLTVSVHIGGPQQVWTSEFQAASRYCIVSGGTAGTATSLSCPNAGIICLKDG